MKILAVLCQDPYIQRDGGTYAVRSSLDRLAQDAEITLTGFGPSFDNEHVGPYRSAGSLGKVRNSVVGFLLSQLQGKPYAVNKYASSTACKRLDKIIKDGDYSLVWLEKLAASGSILYAQNFRRRSWRARIIARTHNVENELLRDRMNISNPLGRFLFSLERRHLKRYERALPTFVNQVFCISGEDCDSFRMLQPACANKIDFLPVTAELPRVEHKVPGKDHGFVLFVGNCSWLPNRKATNWILHELAPLMAKEIPGVRIKLVGSGTDLIEEKPPNVDTMGFVDSIEDLYDGALCTIAPISTGSGVNIKVIESLAHGVPVVGTRFAMRGICSDAYQIAEAPMDYIKAVTLATKKPTIKADRIRTAMEWIEKSNSHFDSIWSDCKKKIME